MKSYKLLFLVGLIACSSNFVFAQNDELTVKNHMGIEVNIKKADVSEACGRVVYLMLTQSAKYKRSTRKLRKALNKKIDMPRRVNKEVAVRFLVNCKGEASGFVTSKNIEGHLADKIIEAFDEIQNWKPGIRRNKPTDMEVILLLDFKNGRIDRINRIKPKALSL